MLAARKALPGDGASSSAYRHAADKILAEASELEPALLRAMLAEALRRRASAPARVVPAIEHLVAVIQTALTEHRAVAAADLASREEGAILAEEHKVLERENLSSGRASPRIPLRRQILEALTLGPRASTDIATHLGAPKETVSRLLGPLVRDQLVVRLGDPDDGRRRVYRLTEAGEAWLGQHTVHGTTPQRPEPLPAKATVAFLNEALAEAVRRRRHDNRLEDAIDRLQSIVRQAVKCGDGALVLRARRELATTLRQAGDRRNFRRELTWFQRAALGQEPLIGRTLALPAFGHWAYEFGRWTEALGGDRIAARTGRLLFAADTYAGLAAQGSDADDWEVRRAWALYSMAENFRQQTDIRRALIFTDKAARIFSERQDAYGIAHCLFLAGFSLRLRGDFSLAQASLDEACERARANDFARLEASILLQLGETRRCQGELDLAGDLLKRAYDGARAIDSPVGMAFALSALGATEFGRGEHAAAAKQLKAAQRLFEKPKLVASPAGLALNLRRRAVAQRALMSQGRAGNAAEVERMIQDARRRYGRLKSPAGVAACLIEAGRLAMSRSGHTAEVRRKLRAMIVPSDERVMLERDPWVPSMLVQFASDAGDGALVEAARDLAEGARRRAQTRDAKQWEFLHASIPGSQELATAPVRNNDDAGVDEMAGEPRRMSELGDVTVVAGAAA